MNTGNNKLYMKNCITKLMLLFCCCCHASCCTCRSGCYHPETYTRYRSGQAAYCSNGARMYCDWGNWKGSCRGGWTNGNDGVWRR
jgi:hypothetical protein